MLSGLAGIMPSVNQANEKRSEKDGKVSAG
jgi:hypothetical protein